ncbi:IS481 family transposase [Mycolicibacterium sp. ELW1]|uniref:IS481 family transposase n=1 Tax=Mycobacteriaceae TaxID=1762 RepID=UPI0011ECA0BC|nr:IS481 family transposase [Mycobacterium sp. ELW1]QEN14844.1 IS481 family transposase [Mycobacterium sp. ELW1]
MSHRNAPLSETGRLRLARCVVEDGWSLRRAADRFQVAVTTASRWASRYREYGPAGMVDRSSRPHRCPNQTPTRTERRIIKVRVIRRWGPARIGYLLGLHPSTVHRVLTRYGMAKLRWLDRGTGCVIRRMQPAECGEMVHIDVKKLGKIPAGGGWRMLGRSVGNRNHQADKSSGQTNKRRQPVRGYHFLHTAIDGYSRLAYSEILSDERKDTAAAFWLRANTWFAQHGINVRKVLTDNGSCYRSHPFRDALGTIEHRRTRPYRPQTNGKVERFHRTLAEEWAYARLYRSDTERCDEFITWLHTYNYHRGHTALGGQPPAARVPNLSGQYN